jgi:predicted amidohydrolase YtcJ
MAFGFFSKKNEYVDIIFMGGKIFTQNPDLPWADAVACKDGLVMAVGDYEDLTEFEGKNTEIVDLEGGVMLPGYIDTCGHTASKAFQDSCLYLLPGDLEDTLGQIGDYAAANQDASIIFAYGYDENILNEVDMAELRSKLDEVCSDRPVAALGKSGFHCFVNTAATELVKAAAEEEEVQTPSLAYVLSVLEPFDLDVLPDAVPAIINKYCERGFTSVFDSGAPDFFASIYLNMMIHMYQEELLKQRYYGSLLVTRDLNPKAIMQKLAQYRTNCVELEGYIDFKTLKIILEGNEENLTISEEILSEYCMDASDKGFDIHIDATTEDAVDEAMDALTSARSAGYKKNAMILAHDPVDDPKELSDSCFHSDIKESSLTLVPDNDWLCISEAKSVREAVDLLTIDAAHKLGIYDSFGSIEAGKHADFVIFDENPLDAKTLMEFKKLQAAMTIIDGNVVYDAKEDDMSQWFAMLTTQQY